MAIFECTGGISPTGNALPSDVKLGVTFSNENDIDQVGTFTAQQKTITSSRRDQTVTPDAGYYLDRVTVEALEPTGTFKPTSRSANIDMGDESNYRYVNTESVPNNNTGTYTFGSGSSGGTVDLGLTNSYRYVNAGNVYSKGVVDGQASRPRPTALSVSMSVTTSDSGGGRYTHTCQGTIYIDYNTGAISVAGVTGGNTATGSSGYGSGSASFAAWG